MKFLVAWAVLALLKLGVVLTLSPFGDEAFYAWEAQHPAWVYSDLPGATAALIGVSTALFGDTVFGLRAPFALMGWLLPLLVVRIARHLGTDEQAWRAGLLAVPIPLLQVLGVLALPDAPLTFAALLSLEAMLQLRAKVTWLATAQLALALALGALTHYRFAPLLLAGAAGFFAMGGARLLRDPRVLIALLVGAAAWWPIVDYNLLGDAAGARFQLVDRHPWQFDAKGLGQPFLQAIITTPVLYGLVLWALWQARGRSGAWRAVWWSALVPIVLYAAFAAFVDRLRFSLHWPLPAYLVAAAMLPALLDDKLGAQRARHWQRWAIGLAAPVALLILGLLGAAGQPALAARTAGTGLYPDNFVGWNEIGAAVASRLQPVDALVADHFMLAAQLSWQLDRRQVVYSLDHYNNHKHGRARQLADWGYDEAGLDALAAGTPAWLVFEVEETPEAQRGAWRHRVCRWFPSPQPVAVIAGPGDGKRYWLYRGVRGNDGPTPASTDATLPPPIDCRIAQP